MKKKRKRKLKNGGQRQLGPNLEAVASHRRWRCLKFVTLDDDGEPTRETRQREGRVVDLASSN
jgi:hypothetical protein